MKKLRSDVLGMTAGRPTDGQVVWGGVNEVDVVVRAGRTVTWRDDVIVARPRDAVEATPDYELPRDVT